MTSSSLTSGKWQHLTVCTDLLEEESYGGLASTAPRSAAGKASSLRHGHGARRQHRLGGSVLPAQDPEHDLLDSGTRTGLPYERCPRALAQRALDYLSSTGLADMAFFGPEPEFFLFDDVRYNSSAGGSFYSVDTIEAGWNTGRLEEGGNLAYKIQEKEDISPSLPTTQPRTSAPRCAADGPAQDSHRKAPP